LVAAAYRLTGSETSLSNHRVAIPILFNSDYYFDGNSESADPGPPRQVLLSTTIRIR